MTVDDRARYLKRWGPAKFKSSADQLRLPFPKTEEQLARIEARRVARLEKAKAERAATRPSRLEARKKKLARRKLARKKAHKRGVLRRAQQRKKVEKRLALKRAQRMYAARKACESRITSLALRAPSREKRDAVLRCAPDWKITPHMDGTNRSAKENKARGERLHKGRHTQHHANKGIVDPNCPFCVPAVNLPAVAKSLQEMVEECLGNPLSTTSP